MKAHPRGAEWEALAERYLRDRGLRTLARNVHCRLGEIDLVMADGAVIVFVEVRYRRNTAFGSAVETVGARKRTRMRRAAGFYLARRAALAERPCRFDVIGISGTPERPRIDWRPAAFDTL
jgi:putative endonuclease